MNAYDEEATRRFFCFVHKTETCWIWTGARNAYGYGRFRYKGVQMPAHKFLIRDAVKPGLLGCHHCDNPPCVNPAHIFLGTQRENNLDMVRKGRGNPLPAALATRGEKNRHAKLKDTEARMIKSLTWRNDALTLLSGHFKVSKATVFDIHKCKKWKSLDSSEQAKNEGNALLEVLAERAAKAQPCS